MNFTYFLIIAFSSATLSCSDGEFLDGRSGAELSNDSQGSSPKKTTITITIPEDTTGTYLTMSCDLDVDGSNEISSRYGCSFYTQSGDIFPGAVDSVAGLSYSSADGKVVVVDSIEISKNGAFHFFFDIPTDSVVEQPAIGATVEIVGNAALTLSAEPPPEISKDPIKIENDGELVGANQEKNCVGMECILQRDYNEAKKGDAECAEDQCEKADPWNPIKADGTYDAAPCKSSKFKACIKGKRNPNAIKSSSKNWLRWNLVGPGLYSVLLWPASSEQKCVRRQKAIPSDHTRIDSSVNFIDISFLQTGAHCMAIRYKPDYSEKSKGQSSLALLGDKNDNDKKKDKEKKEDEKKQKTKTDSQGDKQDKKSKKNKKVEVKYKEFLSNVMVVRFE